MVLSVSRAVSNVNYIISGYSELDTIYLFHLQVFDLFTSMANQRAPAEQLVNANGSK